MPSSDVLDSVSKSAVPPHPIQASEEQSLAQTPVRKSGKPRQQIDVKAELEKRQGGKQLLNLVVIGNVLCPTGLSSVNSASASQLPSCSMGTCSTLRLSMGVMDPKPGALHHNAF